MGKHLPDGFNMLVGLAIWHDLKKDLRL